MSALDKFSVQLVGGDLSLASLGSEICKLYASVSAGF